jgi:signal transduction histidine kinase
VVDRIQVQQVLINLFTNAVESMAETRGRLRRLAVRAGPFEGDGVLVEVVDSGIGMDSGQISHIFDAFFTTKARGTGMGLSLCRSIVESHGGRLWASTRGREGATFHLVLPRNGSHAS